MSHVRNAIFDRIFRRIDALLKTIHFTDRRVERRGLASSGRADAQNDAVAIFANALPVADLGDTPLPERHLRAVWIEKSPRAFILSVGRPDRMALVYGKRV